MQTQTNRTKQRQTNNCLSGVVLLAVIALLVFLVVTVASVAFDTLRPLLNSLS